MLKILIIYFLISVVNFGAININILKQPKTDRLYGFEISGHSGYAESGSDIICASVSSTSLMCVKGLLDNTNDKIEWLQYSEPPYLYCALPEYALSNEISEGAMTLLMTTLQMFQALEISAKSYGGNYVIVKIVDKGYNKKEKSRIRKKLIK